METSALCLSLPRSRAYRSLRRVPIVTSEDCLVSPPHRPYRCLYRLLPRHSAVLLVGTRWLYHKRPTASRYE